MVAQTCTAWLLFTLLACRLAPAASKSAVPKLIPALGDRLESVLQGIDTDASQATLQALRDARLLTPSTVGSFLAAAAAAAAADGKDARPWKTAALYQHLLVQYLRYSRQTQALALLRQWASSGGLQRQQALEQLVTVTDVAGFVRWVKGARHRRHQKHLPAVSRQDDKASAAAASQAAASQNGSSASLPAASDLNDPLNQLVEWTKRLKALGGRLDFLAKGQAAPANTSVTNSSYLNVGLPGFKARRIGVVFHVFQFLDSKGFVYPPQAYVNGSLPAQRMLAVVNSLYRYSGTNIQFYLRQYRINTQKYPYLLVSSGSLYQNCAISAENCLCWLAASNNANYLKYINVYVIGSSTYQPLISNPNSPELVSAQAFTAAIPNYADGCAFLYNDSFSPGFDGPFNPRHSLKQQFVWLNWDRLDPLADNSNAAFNQGGSSLGHELGHAMGLLHTFESCTMPNDGVADTPPEKYTTGRPEEVPLSLCQQVALQGRIPTRAQMKKYDSCKGDRYVDNAFNLMSYSPALCRLFLTRGQIRVMQTTSQKFYKFETA